MPILADIARRKRCEYFLDAILPHTSVLEVGCGSGWVGEYLLQRNEVDYVGVDLEGASHVKGDINEWESLGLLPESFDYIVAFEVVEHVDCWQACSDLLKPGGHLFVTTPIPNRDWVLKILERVGLNQTRTSPHDFLIDLRLIPQRLSQLELLRIDYFGVLAQWATLAKAFRAT